MYFWLHPNFVKSNKAKDMLTKVCEYQRFFSKIVIIDYSNSILYLDSISKGSLLPTMREMKKMKSIKVSNILLFYSENRV